MEPSNPELGSKNKRSDTEKYRFVCSSRARDGDRTRHGVPDFSRDPCGSPGEAPRGWG